MTDTIEPKQYDTRNFYFAAALMSLGCRYVCMTSDDPRKPDKKTFHFTPPDEKFDFETVRADFTASTLMVNAARYADAIRNLKSILHGSE